MEPYTENLDDYEPRMTQSLSRLIKSPELEKFTTYSDGETDVITNLVYNDWIAHSQSEYDQIFSEGKATMKIGADALGGEVVIRPINHDPRIYQGKLKREFIEEVESLKQNENKEVYFEDHLLTDLDTKHLSDHEWAQEILGLAEEDFYDWIENQFDSRQCTGSVKSADGEEQSRDDLLSYLGGKAPDADLNKYVGVGIWFTSFPEPVQAKLDKEQIGKDTAIINSGRSIQMAREIEKENQRLENNQLNVYVGAGHAPGIYQVLEGSDVKQEVYDILEIDGNSI